MSRSEAIEKKIAERENMMQLIYQMGIQDDYSREAYDTFLQLQLAEKNVTDYSEQLYGAFALHRQEIDQLISDNSNKWKTSRMPAVDLAILRLSLTEIMYMDSIPVSVSINEAVNLAKRFSTEKSSSFINGILGNIVRNPS